MYQGTIPFMSIELLCEVPLPEKNVQDIDFDVNFEVALGLVSQEDSEPSSDLVGTQTTVQPVFHPGFQDGI